MLVLATVHVHETNQHFYGMLLGRREGVCKKSTLCTLVKMLKIMDRVLAVHTILLTLVKSVCTLFSTSMYSGGNNILFNKCWVEKV